MNTFSTTQLLKCAMLMGSLIIPAVTWAADHLLSVNGATITQPAIVPHSGMLAQPMILSDFDDNATLILGESQSLSVVSTPVKICARGTKDNLEWLDQGDSVVGVTGMLTGTSDSDRYQLTLTMDGISDTYAASNGSCTDSGAKTYTYIAGAVMDKEFIGGGSVINNLAGSREDKHNGGNKDKQSDNNKDKRGDGREDRHNGDNKDKQNDSNKDKRSDGREDKHNGGNKDKLSGAIGSSVTVPGITAYNFWNATNGIPEPGTMFLFLIGLLGFGWLSMTRKRQTQGASA